MKFLNLIIFGGAAYAGIHLLKKQQMDKLDQERKAAQPRVGALATADSGLTFSTQTRADTLTPKARPPRTRTQKGYNSAGKKFTRTF